jgi:hypothetical protein
MKYCRSFTWAHYRGDFVRDALLMFFGLWLLALLVSLALNNP